METQHLAGTAPAQDRIRRVATDRPWVWLAAGWQDLLATRGIGLLYGAAFCLFGLALSLLLFQFGVLWAILPSTAGFFLLAPLLATGLFEVSRLRAAGRSPRLADLAGPFRRNGAQIAYIGIALLLLHLFWVRIAGLIFVLFFGISGGGPLEQLPQTLLRSPDLLPFLVVGTGFGLILAAVSFMVSAISLPMLVDRADISAMEAVIVSIQAVMQNRGCMLLWAVLIVGFTGLALVPFYLGLIIVLPLVGHASWHAYRELVVR